MVWMMRMHQPYMTFHHRIFIESSRAFVLSIITTIITAVITTRTIINTNH